MAVRVQGDPNVAKNGVFYLLNDHLGSTSLTLDSSGNKLAELRYKPWGHTRYADGSGCPIHPIKSTSPSAEPATHVYSVYLFTGSLTPESQSLVANP